MRTNENPYRERDSGNSESQPVTASPDTTMSSIETVPVPVAQVSHGKKFAGLVGLRSRPKPEPYEEQGTKRPLRYRDEDHRKHHEAMVAADDDWWEDGLISLTTQLLKDSPELMLKLWRKTLKAYNKKRPGSTVPYNFTANRGALGVAGASAHVILKTTDFPDIYMLADCWKLVTRHIGGDWELTTAGGRATLYFSKNATEPHAIEEDYRCKKRWSEL